MPPKVKHDKFNQIYSFRGKFCSPELHALKISSADGKVYTWRCKISSSESDVSSTSQTLHFLALLFCFISQAMWMVIHLSMCPCTQENKLMCWCLNREEALNSNSWNSILLTSLIVPCRVACPFRTPHHLLVCYSKILKSVRGGHLHGCSLLLPWRGALFPRVMNASLLDRPRQPFKGGWRLHLYLGFLEKYMILHLMLVPLICLPSSYETMVCTLHTPTVLYLTLCSTWQGCSLRNTFKTTGVIMQEMFSTI